MRVLVITAVVAEVVAILAVSLGCVRTFDSPDNGYPHEYITINSNEVRELTYE